MKKYVLKRLLSLIPTIFIVSVVIFLLVHLTPGDPACTNRLTGYNVFLTTNFWNAKLAK